jgi:uncharacterized protein
MELRKSSYTISVKLEREEGKHMLVHGYTGAIDVVRQNVVDYLDSVGGQQPDGAQVSEATLEALKARGYLTPKTNEEEVEHVRKLANLLHQKNKKLHKSFLFLVAYDCNFRCPYCYESRVLKNSRQWTKKVFTKEMVDRAYEAMLQVEPERKLHSPKIALYGGEPLLAQNREIVEYIVQKGAAVGYSFMAVTNGYDLDAFEELLGPGKIASLQITVDGVKDTHDRRRIHYQTKTSFDKIVANIGMALKQGVEVSVRVNTDADNFDELSQIERIFRDLGYYSTPNLKIYSALLYDYTTAMPKKIKFLNQTEFNERHKEVAYKYSCLVSMFADILRQAIVNHKKISFASTYCAAQSSAYILDPFGDIYSCWENVGDLEKIVGHYTPDGIEWTKIRDVWQRQNIATSSDCVRCKYAFLCRGGCIAKSILKTGKFSPGFCNSFPKTFRESINLIYSDVCKQQ